MNTVALITSSEGACFQKFDFAEFYIDLVRGLWSKSCLLKPLTDGWCIHIYTRESDNCVIASTPLVEFHSILIPRRKIIGKYSYYYRWDALNRKLEPEYINREVYNGLEWHEQSCRRDRV